MLEKDCSSKGVDGILCRWYCEGCTEKSSEDYGEKLDQASLLISYFSMMD